MAQDYWKGKSVVIAGGSAGFGLQLTKSFLAAGAHVTLVARDAARLERASSGLLIDNHDLNARVRSIRADVTDDASTEMLFAQLADQPIDAWVNAVGKSDRGRVLDVTPDEFRDLFEFNFLTVVRCSRLAVPRLLKTKGHLINIGSLASKSGSRFLGAYPASKFPLAAYSQQLRLELGPEGLHVLLVCPGPISREDTGRRYDELADGLPEEARKPGAGVKVKQISPEVLADAILAACERRKPELVMPAKARILFGLSQIWPSLGDWILRKKT